MELGSLFAFWTVSALLAVTPGADWALAISMGLRRRGVPAVLGLLLGHTVAAIAVVCGLAAVVATSPPVFTTITVLGALYLIFLGVGALRADAVRAKKHQREVVDTSQARGHAYVGAAADTFARAAGDGVARRAKDATATSDHMPADDSSLTAGDSKATSWRGAAAQGVGVSLLNPKVVLLFLALLPQFTEAEASWPLPLQMGVLSVLHIANCAAVYFGVSLGLGAVLMKRPRAARVVAILSGIVMALLGIGIIVGEILT